MLETNIFGYYAFGYDYYLLRYNCEGINVRGDSNSLVMRLDSFFASLDELNLQVTKTAAAELFEIRKNIEEFPAETKVDSTLANRIAEVIGKIDAALDAELKLRSAFIVTPKRYGLDHLLRNPQNLFGSFIFEKLPSLCQFDFSQATRCISFGLPTASVFHLMRATEGVLRYYYCFIVKHKRVKILMWYDMVQHLRERRGAPPKALLDSLDNIRINFRNPTQHPEARFDMDEAQDLLSVSIDTTNRMIKDLLSREKKS